MSREKDLKKERGLRFKRMRWQVPAVGVVSLERGIDPWALLPNKPAVLYVELFRNAPSAGLWLRIPTTKRPKKTSKIKEVSREEYKVYCKKLRKERGARKRQGKPNRPLNYAAESVARSAQAQNLCGRLKVPSLMKLIGDGPVEEDRPTFSNSGLSERCDHWDNKQPTGMNSLMTCHVRVCAPCCWGSRPF